MSNYTVVGKATKKECRASLMIDARERALTIAYMDYLDAAKDFVIDKSKFWRELARKHGFELEGGYGFKLHHPTKEIRLVEDDE